MASEIAPSEPRISRRALLKAGLGGAAGLALYSTIVARHWIDVTHHDLAIKGLPAAFDGLRIVQMSDIHLDEFTEPLFLDHAITLVNEMNPDLVLLTGDFVSFGLSSRKFAVGSAWQCANLLTALHCPSVYAVLGNHDHNVSARIVTTALVDNGIKVLTNSHTPIERSGSRLWLAGVDDPVMGEPNPELAIPPTIRDVPNEPVILMCHAPDYADDLLRHPAGRSVDLMLSGHTHGGQVRLPIVGAMQLPPMGRKYVEGAFTLGRLQLYVNRGLGTVGVPFRFDCPPEISQLTLRTG
jgi:predicted MPP superfamily phosphohydrolase